MFPREARNQLTVVTYHLCVHQERTNQLTKHETNDATSEFNQALEEIDNEVQCAIEKLECDLEGILGKVAGSGEERHNKLHDGRRDVGEGFDDG